MRCINLATFYLLTYFSLINIFHKRFRSGAAHRKERERRRVAEADVKLLSAGQVDDKIDSLRHR